MKSLQPISVAILLTYPSDYDVLVTGLKSLGQIKFLFADWVRWFFQLIGSGPVVQKLNRLCDNLREVPGVTLVLNLIRFKSSINVYQAALLQVLLAGLAQAFPGLHID